MTQHNLSFIASQAAEGIVFTTSNNVGNLMAPGNRASFSSASFKLTDSNALGEFEEDGGQWIGTVFMLPDNVVSMTATYFPVRGSVDNIQLCGPIMMTHAESAIAVVGGGGKFAGARGEARCKVSLSDRDSPIYRYEIAIEV